MSAPLIAYYRVSTDKQGQSGLDAQRSAVTSYIAGRGELMKEFRNSPGLSAWSNHP